MRLVATIVLGFFLTGLLASPAQPQTSSSVKRDRSNFRYVIVSDSLLHNGRLVFVLLDEELFSEASLKQLFFLISKRFSKPDELHVAVFTNLEQIATPEVTDNSLPSGQFRGNTTFERYPSAVYIRNEGNESFSYRTAGRHGVEKTLILKGEDLLHPKKKQNKIT